MNILMTFAMYVAGLGLFLSLIVHVSSLTGLSLPFNVELKLLIQGMFIVGVPAIFASNIISRGFKPKDFWKAALRACPKWMKYLPAVLFGYAVLVTILMALGVTEKVQENAAFCMALYSLSMAMLYSAIHAKNYDEARRCPK